MAWVESSFRHINTQIRICSIFNGVSRLNISATAINKKILRFMRSCDFVPHFSTLEIFIVSLRFSFPLGCVATHPRRPPQTPSRVCNEIQRVSELLASSSNTSIFQIKLEQSKKNNRHVFKDIFVYSCCECAKRKRGNSNRAEKKRCKRRKKKLKQPKRIITEEWNMRRTKRTSRNWRKNEKKQQQMRRYTFDSLRQWHKHNARTAKEYTK